MSPLLRTLARWALGLTCALSSVYALLCSLPFSWNNLIAPGNLPPWAELFVRFHPLFWLAAAALAAAALLRDSRKNSALFWGGLHAGLGFFWIAAPLLPSLTPEGRSFLWSLALWEPFLSWEILQVLPRLTPRLNTRLLEDKERLLYAPLLAALGVFCASAASRWTLSGPVGSIPETLYALLRGSLFHLAAGASLSCLLCALRRLCWNGPRTFTALCLGVFAGSAFLIEKNLLLPLSLRGPQAALFSFFGAAALTWLFADLLSDKSRLRHAPMLSAAAAAALPGISILLAPLDWEALLQTLAVCFAWAFALHAAFHVPERVLKKMRTTRKRLPAAWAAAAACVLLLWGTELSVRGFDPLERRLGLRLRPALSKLSETDPSLRSLRRLLRRPGAPSGFFRHLQSRTHIALTMPASIPDIGDCRSPAQSARPDVFVFVLDSLRPDYLGAYNPAVRFTPNFDSFARTASVFQRAYTPYGGTGLAEPALWTGSLLPHQQYPPDLRRMDLLEKSVIAGGYRPILTILPVLEAVLTPPPGTVPLKRIDGNYRLCDALSQVESLLSKPASGKPDFVYVQAEDVHIALIEREGRSANADPAYAGFHAPYAARVQAMDRCFGRFTDFLKRSGRWERSVVVVLSDHGDSLGEDGRWGHAYSIAPEILRIPLIVHAPSALLTGRSPDTQAAALETDVAPTLAPWMGCMDPGDDPLRGRSLFPLEGTASLPRQEQLTASSYAPVYGLLDDEARRLYVADGANRREYLFELDGTPGGRPIPLARDSAEQARGRMQAWLDLIDERYGLKRLPD
ncbi:MAG: sulfatase-like hydrolase/transferase [Elusimicrobiota bacterium]|jgi:hypothetical protein